MMIARDVVPGYALVVAHNRDELHRRDWEPPGIHATEPASVRPTDRAAGGTWIGLNSQRLLVAVTNRAFDGRHDPARRSRGLLCAEALGCRSAEEAALRVEREVRARPYNGFNLVLADTKETYLVGHSEQLGWFSQPLAPGVHLVSSQHGLSPAVLAEQRQALHGATASEQTFAAQLDRFLSDHTMLTDAYSVCKHMGAYGTVCATKVWLPASAAPPRFDFARGAPCQVAFAPVPVAELGATPPSTEPM